MSTNPTPRRSAQRTTAFTPQQTIHELQERQRKSLSSAAEVGAFLGATAAIRAAAEPPERRHLQAWELYLRTGRVGPDLEHRDLGEATGPAGGYLAPQVFGDAVLMALRYASAFFQFGHIWESDSGAAGFYPIVDEVTVNAAVQGENTAMGDTNDLGLRQLAFGSCPTYALPNLIRASRALLQDVKWPLQDTLADAFAQRLARGADAAFVTSLLAGVTQITSTALATATTYAELVTAAYTLDLAYRGALTSCWIAHKTTVAQLRLITDTNGRPILLDNVTMRAAPDGTVLTAPLLLGRPVLESNAMPVWGAGNKVLLFGDWAHALVIRVAEQPVVLRLDERFAEFAEVGFTGFARIDALPAVTAAAVVVQLHA